MQRTLDECAERGEGVREKADERGDQGCECCVEKRLCWKRSKLEQETVFFLLHD